MRKNSYEYLLFPDIKRKSMYVMSKSGHYREKGLFDGDKKIGEVYECKDGYQYIKSVDGKKYALHPETEEWHHA
ncbi:MAG: hypothetical protein HC866_21880 [Leptolyngbyaceae cyanobacterium RU_5_1]|nr:hypothetical protein [Leptolyngbyaceae cyanobacterium RU_5_1]